MLVPVLLASIQIIKIRDVFEKKPVVHELLINAQYLFMN